MTKNTAQMIATTLGVVAALFYMSAAFDILPSNIGIFLGIAASLITGLFWTFAGRAEK
jgi:hypothetical protein